MQTNGERVRRESKTAALSSSSTLIRKLLRCKRLGCVCEREREGGKESELINRSEVLNTFSLETPRDTSTARRGEWAL